MYSTSTSNPKPSNCCPLENLLGRACLEQLEAALRIVERQARGHAHRQVEEPAHVLPKWRLMHADQRPIERPRAENDLRTRFRRHFPELFQFADGRRKVRVREQAPIALRLQHSVAHRIAFAAVPEVRNQPHTGIASHRRGAVPGAVIDHQDLAKLPGTAGKVLPNRFQGGGEPFLFVERWNDNGNRSTQK